jgi:hypothetical protein
MKTELTVQYSSLNIKYLENISGKESIRLHGFTCQKAAVFKDNLNEGESD